MSAGKWGKELALLAIVALLILGFAIPTTSATSARFRIITSPNAQTRGYFGYSVAVSNHVTVVGAPFESVGTYPEAGHVYIENVLTGALIATLTSPNTQAGGGFGYSVAINGTTVVVGAPGETGGLFSPFSGGGNVYIFNTTGSLIRTFTSPDEAFDGEFGYSVAVGSAGIIVGAPGEHLGPGVIFPRAGLAYVYSPTYDAVLISPFPQDNGHFGSSVGVIGTNFVVGAPGEIAGASYRYPSICPCGEAGHAYLFTMYGALIATLASPNATPGGLLGGNFGWSLATSGDRLVVGAPVDNTAGFLAGTDNGLGFMAGDAYTYSCSATACSPIGALSSPNPQTGGRFGLSVSLTSTIVVVGAPGESIGGYSGPGQVAGRVYLCSITKCFTTTLTNPDPQTNGNLGTSVAVSRLVGSRIAVIAGAPNETASTFVGAGHAYLYLLGSFCPDKSSTTHPLT